MRITLDSTDKIVELTIEGKRIPARIWQGMTTSGIPVHAYITRIVPEVHKTDPDIDNKTAQFERELQRCVDPRPAIEAIPMRMIL